MSLLLTFAIFSIVIVALYSLVYTYKHCKNDDREKLPPGPRAFPIIGNLHMLGTLPHRTLHHLAQKYGPIMSLRLGRVPTIVVSSPEFASLFLKTLDTIFASRPKVEVYDHLTYGTKGIAFTEYGSYWRNVRKLCTLQLLSASKIELFAPMRREELSFLVENLKNSAMAHEVVNLSVMVGKFAHDMTCKMVFGCSYDDEFNLKKLIREGMTLLGAFNIADFLPCLRALDIQGFARRSKAISKSMDKVFEKIIREREKGASKQQKLHRDFVDVLLSMLDQPMNPNDETLHKIDRTNIKAMMLDMIFAGLETSSAVIEWVLSELLRHPRVMIRLQEELGSVIGMNKKVEEKDLSKLPYLDMVVKETLRLYPVAPLLVPHESMQDVTINGYYIPKKSRIIVNVWALGRDSRIWSNNATNFLPERFINNDINFHGHDFKFLPFGSGRRRCPGMQLGLTIIRFVVAQLVHCFDWKLPNGMLPNELDMGETFGLTMPRAKHLYAIPSYRLYE